VPIAVIVFQFDPYAQLLGDLAVRWGTIALGVAIVLALILAAVLARGGGLRVDDIVFIAVGIVPGAVIGGRIGFALLHWSFYSAEPGVLIDPSVGGLELGLGVVGGTLSGAYVASLLGSPLGRWLHVAAAPALFAIGAGKLSMVLTGTGQGVPSDDAWATAYAGPGPWGSVAPLIPSHPSQAYEGIATLAILALLAILLMIGAFRRRDGRLFYLAIGLWAVARAVVSTTWRDPAVVGGLPAGGVIAAAIALGCAVMFLGITAMPAARASESPVRTEPEATVPTEPQATPSTAPEATPPTEPETTVQAETEHVATDDAPAPDPEPDPAV
jgi:prolipoprotein diacylglyceryltransferase